MNELRYVYFGKDNSAGGSHKGIMTVGYTFAEPINKMIYGVSFCSPNDRFIKEVGRRIVNARVSNGVISFSEKDYKSPPPFGETIQDIINIFKESISSREYMNSNYKPEEYFCGIAIPFWCGVDIVER